MFNFLKIFIFISFLCLNAYSATISGLSLKYFNENDFQLVNGKISLKSSGSDTFWTNSAPQGIRLAGNTNNSYFRSDGGYFSGLTNSNTGNLNRYDSSANQFGITRDITQGEVSNVGVGFADVGVGKGISAFTFDIEADSFPNTEVNWLTQVENGTASGQSSTLDIMTSPIAGLGANHIQWGMNDGTNGSKTVLNFVPNQNDNTTAPYRFDTFYPITGGNLVEFGNSSTNVVIVTRSGLDINNTTTGLPVLIARTNGVPTLQELGDGKLYIGVTNDSLAGLSRVLSKTATLNFGSTAAQSSTDLTVTVTGAVDADIVIVTPPSSAVNANSSFSGFVSAADTVKVRFNNYSSGAVDPASAAFRVDVIQH